MNTAILQIEKRFLTALDSCGIDPAADRIVLGISGGSDSMALLYLFSGIYIKKRLIAVYINHGLRKEEAAEESRQLQNICKELGVSFTIKEVLVQDYARENGCSIEESARILRYKAFREIARQNNCAYIAVAHTADDQIENFFIRLIRGAGVSGIKGMRYRYHDIIRPLLDFSKKELQHYLNYKDINWLEDSSNSDCAFLRNRVRLQLLPLLKEKFSPAIDKQVLQLITIVKEEDRFLDKETEKQWSSLIKRQHSPPALFFMAAEFSVIDNAIKRRIIEKCIIQMGGKPSFTHIEEIIRLTGQKKGELHLPDGLRVEKSDQQILFHRPLPQGEKRGSGRKTSPFNMEIIEPGIYQLPENRGEVELSIIYIKNSEEIAPLHADPPAGTLLLDADKLAFPLILRSLTAGDRFFPCNGNGRKKVARYFADKKIPPQKRAQWPLLVYKDRIAAIAGLIIDDAFRLTDTTRKILLIKYLEISSNIAF